MQHQGILKSQMTTSDLCESFRSTKNSKLPILHSTSSKTIPKVSVDLLTSPEDAVYHSGCDVGVLCRVFETFDENGDGKLSVDEIRQSIAKLGLNMTEKELASMMMALDKNSNGFVDLEEFLSIYRMNCNVGLLGCIDEEDDENLKRAFRVFDKNKDGYINAQELQIVLSSIGLVQGNINLVDCRNMIRGVDLDGDGQINFREFKVMMSRKCSRCSAFSSNSFDKNLSSLRLSSSGKVRGQTY